jgi:hypothetical protein
MKPITKEFISQHTDRLNELSKSDDLELVNRLKQEQPAVYRYMLGVSSTLFSESEKKWFLFLSVAIWWIVLNSQDGILTPNDKDIAECSKTSADMLRFLKDENSKNDTMVEIIKKHPQPILLQYLLNTIMFGVDRENTIREEVSGLMFVSLKVILDCFCMDQGKKE